MSSTGLANRVRSGTVDPALCNPGDIFLNKASGILKICLVPNVWANAAAVALAIGTAILNTDNIGVLFVDNNLLLGIDSDHFTYDDASHTLTLLNLISQGNISVPAGLLAVPTLRVRSVDTGFSSQVPGVFSAILDGTEIFRFATAISGLAPGFQIKTPVGQQPYLYVFEGNNDFNFVITAIGPGIMQVLNDNLTGFGRLILGPANTLYPSLKPDAVTGLLQVRLGDDSADAPLSAKSLTLSGQIQGANWKALTEAADTGFVDITVPVGGTVAGKIEYTVQADDGSDFQVESGELYFTAVNKAGTVTTGISPTAVGVAVQSRSSGTLTNNNFTAVGGANKTTLKANFTSSLTQTTLKVNFRVIINTGVATVTPL